MAFEKVGIDTRKWCSVSDDDEIDAVPVAFAVDAVARCAWHIFDDGRSMPPPGRME